MDIAELRKLVRRELLAVIRHLNVGLPEAGELSKESIRVMHSAQRSERGQAENAFVCRVLERLLPNFAEGAEVCAEKIEPVLQLVQPGSGDSELFRLATLLWSVPV